MRRVWSLVGLLSMVFAAGCGGSGGLNDSALGSIRPIVQGIGKAVTHPAAVIDYFEVTVTSADFAPIVAQFPGTAESGTIKNVPVGKDRAIAVVAVNANGQTIRAGEAGGVIVAGGQATDVPITLEPVPVFVNLREGNAVANTRLRPEILSDPERSVRLSHTNLADGDELPLLDAALGIDTVIVNVSTSLAEMQVGLLTPGSYQFNAYDVENGRTSHVTVQVVDGTRRRGAGLFSAARTVPQLMRLGTPWNVRWMRADDTQGGF